VLRRANIGRLLATVAEISGVVFHGAYTASLVYRVCTYLPHVT
jgi:hypothetical protein